MRSLGGILLFLFFLSVRENEGEVVKEKAGAVF